MMQKGDLLELAEMRDGAEVPWELWPVAKELEREGRAVVTQVRGAGCGWIRVVPTKEQHSIMDT